MDTERGHEADRDRRVTVSESKVRLSRKRVRGLMAVSLAIALVGLTVPVRGDESSKLLGAWDCDEGGARSSLEFLSTTQLSYNGQVAAMELAPDSFLVEEEYGSVLYLYGFEGDSLVILVPDGSLTWCGKSAAPVSSPMTSGQSSDVGDASPGTLEPGPDWPVYARPVGTVSEDAPSAQALLYKFAGRWDHVSTNTLTNLYLAPDGTYESSYESSYSGEDGDWAAAGNEQDRGRWMIQGSLREGVLTLIAPDGGRAAYRYQVHVRDGETYWSEYFFDGEMYTVDYVYR